MQHLRQLLALENSKLAEVLRFSLRGLEATLAAAKQEYPQDPGFQVCDEVLQELDHLLQSAPVTNSPPTTGELTAELKLIELREAFNNDSELHAYLGNLQLQSENDADLWHEIQRKLLRIPENLATVWQQKSLEFAQNVGAVVDEHHLYELPFIRDEIIYPGLTGAVQAGGLCLSQTALLNSPLGQKHSTGDLHLLAGFLLFYYKMLQIEPDLYHALKSVFSFDVVSLQSKPEQKNQYWEALGDRFQRVLKSEENTDTLANLRAWIDMDEAIHSLIFIPPAERYSWWGNLQQESRRILKKIAEKAIKAGNDVRIKQLSGLYADICALSKDDLQLDFGGTPGEVLTCLRVYVRINQEEFPGRVIFRSLR